MQLSLALDIGTTSLAAVAVDERGQVRASVRGPNPAHRQEAPAGHAEQDPRLLLEAAVELLRALAARIDDRPAALGLTGQMHGVLLAGPGNRPLTPLISWQDRRANEEQSGGQTYLDALIARCPPDALEASGCRPAPGYGGVTLHVLRQQGALPNGDWLAVTAADWIAASLTGAQPCMDASMAASLGLFDVSGGRWSGALLDAAGIESHRLPPIVESGAYVGALSAEMALATGLPSGLPVTTAIGDNQAAVLGSVPAAEDALQINIGTGGQINWPVDQYARVDGMDTRPLPIGRLMLTGAGVSGGDAYAWVARTVAGWLTAFGETHEPGAIYARLAELAAAVPEDSGGLSSRPVFRGSRRRPLERGSFAGVTFENFTPGHVARAVLAGVAEGLREFLDAAGDARPRGRRIIATGNAIRRNPVLTAALQKSFGLPVAVPEHDEEAAYGAALLAGTAAGTWGTLAEAGAAIRLRLAPGVGQPPTHA